MLWKLGIILIPLVITFVWVGGLPFFIFLTAILLVAQAEFYSVSTSPQASPKKLVCLGAGFLILASSYIRTTDMLLSTQKGIPAFILTFSVIILLLIHLFNKNIRYFVDSLGISLAGIFMVPWLGSYLLLLRDIAPFGKQYFFMLLAGVWTVDTAAYAFGTKFGGRKLAKTISPKKTIAGFISGFISGMIFAFIWLTVVKINFLNWKDALFFGAVIGIAGQLGDLVESMFKRSCMVKDTGGLFPGHGGAYDRIDSIIFAAPFLYYYLVIFVK